MEAVRYKSIKGFPKYRVGDDGSVWSYRYVRGSNGLYKWKKLHGKRYSHDGYVLVNLFEGENHRPVFVHILVLEAFIGPCPEGMEACHWDDTRNNNNLHNLRWDTHKSNCADATRNGKRAKTIDKAKYITRRGVFHKRARLNPFKVQQIRQLSGKQSHAKIAQLFDVNRPCVTAVINRRTWDHVT